MADCVDGVRDVLISVPSHGLRETLVAVKPLLADDARVCWATKGFELHTGRLPHQVVGEVLGKDRPVAVLSGPTFAAEVGAGLPTAMTVAATDRHLIPGLQGRQPDGVPRQCAVHDAPWRA